MTGRGIHSSYYYSSRIEAREGSTQISYFCSLIDSFNTESSFLIFSIPATYFETTKLSFLASSIELSSCATFAMVPAVVAKKKAIGVFSYGWFLENWLIISQTSHLFILILSRFKLCENPTKMYEFLKGLFLKMVCTCSITLTKKSNHLQTPKQQRPEIVNKIN